MTVHPDALPGIQVLRFASPRPSFRYLVIDDDPTVRELTVAALTARGSVALPCADAAEALQQARGVPPDLIVVESIVRGMDCAALIRALRAELGPVPVVFYSSSPGAAARLAREVGAADVIEKPYPWRGLAIRLETYARRPTELPLEPTHLAAQGTGAS